MAYSGIINRRECYLIGVIVLPNCRGITKDTNSGSSGVNKVYNQGIRYNKLSDFIIFDDFNC